MTVSAGTTAGFGPKSEEIHEVTKEGMNPARVRLRVCLMTSNMPHILLHLYFAQTQNRSPHIAVTE